MIRKLILAVVLLALFPAYLSATDFYVSPSGNDSNSGSQASPWLTIQKCTNNGGGGVICHVLAGSYAGADLTHSGASISNRFVLQCDPGIASATAAINQCKIWSNPFQIDANFLDIVGFDIGNNANMNFCSDAIAPAGNSVHMIGNYCHDLAANVPGGGINGCPQNGALHWQSGVSDPQANRNLVLRFGSSAARAAGCNFAHMIYFSGTGTGQIAQNNVLVEPVVGGIVTGASCNSTFTNNTIVNAKDGIIFGQHDNSRCVGGPGHNTVANNALFGSSNTAVFNVGGTADCSTANPTLFSHNESDGVAPDFSPARTSCDTVSPNPWSHQAASSFFVNYQIDGSGNYQLKAGSIGIGSGSSPTTCVSGGLNPCIPPTDFLKVARPSTGAQDVGAYVKTSAGVPVVSFSPSPLAFGTVPVSTSVDLTATLTNTGGANLTFSPATITGTNASAFKIKSTTCATPLGASSSCQYVITATPAVTGNLTANLSLTDNAAGSPHQLPLTVTGGSSGLTLNPTSLSFGVIAPNSCSASQSSTLTNSGNAALIVTGKNFIGTGAAQFTFGGTGTCGVVPLTIAAGQSCIQSVKFCPTSAGSFSASLSFPNNSAVSPVNLALSGTGGAGTATLTPATFAYGNVQVGTSVSHSFVYTNTGSLALSNIVVSLTGATTSYSQSNNCPVAPATLAPSATCTIVTVFKPAVTGALNGTLSVASSATVSPTTAALSGTGTNPSIVLSSSSINFGQVIVGTTSGPSQITVTNVGSAPALISGVSTALPFAQSNNCPASLAVNNFCTITLTASPASTGLVNGTVSVADNAPGNPHQASLSVTGVSPLPGFSPASINFGNQPVGSQTAEQKFVYTNGGTGPLFISAVALAGTNPGDFAIGTNTCNPGTVALSDTFSSGSLNLAKWVIDTGNSPAPGPGNTGTFAANHVSLAQGQLELILTQTAGSPILSVGAEVRSVNTFGYGTYSWTARAGSTSATPGGAGSAVSGQVTGLFNYFQNNGLGAPNFTENDFEVEGQFPTQLEMTSWASASPILNTETNSTQSGMASAAHTYKFVWVQGRIDFYFDGTLISTHTTNVPTAPAFVLQNFYGTNSVSFGGTATTGTTRHLYVSSFSLVPAVSLAAGQSCIVGVTFKPTTTGSRSATVSISDSSSTSPNTAAVSGTGVTTAPAVSLSTTSLNFGNIPVNSTSGSLPIVVTNTGTANLVFSSITPTGNFSETDNCTTVVPGGTCTINGKFAPLSAGPLTGQFSLATNAASSPNLVALQGFGTQTGATLTSTAPFGHVTVGNTSSPIVLTLTNTGNVTLTPNTPTIDGTGAGAFSFTGNCPSLAVNGTCTYGVIFTPPGAASFTATFHQTFADGTTPVTSALSGTGDAPLPTVSLTPTTIDFGNVQQGSPSATKTIQLQNTSLTTLNLLSILPGGAFPADVAITSHCGTTPVAIPAGNVCNVDVVMTPSTVGDETASVVFTTDAASSPDSTTLAVRGTSVPVPRVLLSPSSLSFSPPSIQTTTTSAAQTVVANNIGDADLLVTNVALTGVNQADFTLSTNCGTVPAGLSCQATINCAPALSHTGSLTASVVFTDNASGSPHSAALTCTAFDGTPTITLGITKIDFGNQTVGTTSNPLTFLVTNTGTATASGLAVTASGDFAVTGNCGSTLTAGSNCSEKVTFSPQVLCGQSDDQGNCTSNVHLGQIQVVSNTSNSPQTIALQGTATPVPPPPGPVRVTLGGVLVLGGHLVAGVQ